MFVVEFEGNNGGGKHTQATELCKRLKLRGLRAEVISFPDYTLSKGMIQAWQSRGTTFVEDVYAPAMLYALNRSERLATLNIQGLDALIFDRYTYSNALHKTTHMTAEERKSFVQFLEQVEFEHMKLPKPDIVLMLHVPVDMSMEWVKRRGYNPLEGEDVDEGDINHAKAVDAAMLDVSRCMTPAVRYLNCCAGAVVKSVGRIADEVEAIVIGHMNLLKEMQIKY